MKALFTNIQARGRATNVIATRRRNVDDSAIKNAELVTACNAKHATNEDAVKFEIDEMTIDQIVEANQDRNNLIINAQHYDPITGEGSCGPRVKRSVDIDVFHPAADDAHHMRMRVGAVIEALGAIHDGHAQGIA